MLIKQIIVFLMCLVALSSAQWSKQECKNQWKKRLRQHSTCFAGWKVLSDNAIDKMCDDSRCRVGASDWDGCCKYICKIHGNGSDFRDEQTKKKCCCDTGGVPGDCYWC